MFITWDDIEYFLTHPETIKEKKQLSRILSNERRNALWITIRSLSISLWMQAKSC